MDAGHVSSHVQGQGKVNIKSNFCLNFGLKKIIYFNSTKISCLILKLQLKLLPLNYILGLKFMVFIKESDF